LTTGKERGGGGMGSAEKQEVEEDGSMGATVSWSEVIVRRREEIIS
jgi:hypothetical protein